MASTVAVTSSDNGKSVDVRVGDEILVILAENPTTGYRWKLEPADGSVLGSGGDTFEMAADPAIGSGGAHHFRFAARAPGRTTIALKLRRAWASDEPAVRTFSVEVTVSS
jgi:inhibitor of cysteine peptidase